ncbi:MAG: hypothetical protein IH589_03685 [Anaerolineales bacterium]|nr:hypothetical protein [Anaerolineales bacterium]
MPSKKTSIPEDSKEILTAEFNYIAATATQANEDRARAASFYLISVGSLVAALFSTQLIENSDTPTFRLLFSGLFLILTFLGTTTILQLARLRLAWYESMLAMNQIKEYAIEKDKGLQNAFRWKKTTAPPLYKTDSISFQQTLEVASLCGLTFGAAVYFAASSGCVICTWLYTIFSALFVFLLELNIYKRKLTKK